ncbi:GcrA family cell cycle regulator [Nitratireductor sp. GISD-1A_MAKvit]|uniref:GcrA family cell cycle regulator n=1 Tax=Nitratireductor sp. GISD-1A_MAKvit TaxID=3234198 RepID=UPI0034651B2E
MNWTDERVETLKKLWAEGLSASQIAAQLGGVSRNAVIGKVHRLKLSSRGRATSTRTRQKKAAPAAPSSTTTRRPRTTRPTTVSVGATALQAQFDEEPVAQTYMRPVENVVVPISRKLELVQLTETTCKWPNGDPLSEDFSFCGNETGENGPYCGYHSRLAYQPASERRRSR